MDAPPALVLDLIEWVALEARPYDEVMLHWRTSCPGLPVWEDAVDAGLVRCESRNGRTFVTATEKGLSLLEERR